jgi:hypothetical protein
MSSLAAKKQISQYLSRVKFRFGLSL